VVTQRVIDKLRLHNTPADLAAKINATNVPPKTALIDIAATDDSPQQAQLIARTLAGEFISYVEALETPTGQDGQKVHTTVVTAASEPQQDVLQPVLLGMLAAVAALLAGAIAVWLRASNNPVVGTSGQAERSKGSDALRWSRTRRMPSGAVTAASNLLSGAGTAASNLWRAVTSRVESSSKSGDAGRLYDEGRPPGLQLQDVPASRDDAAVATHPDRNDQPGPRGLFPKH
jgi:hypothetical protein